MTTSRSKPRHRVADASADGSARPDAPVLALDTALLAAVSLLAIAALHPVFGGDRFLLVGGVGFGVGALLALLVWRFDWPVWPSVLGSVAAFFLLGGTLVSGNGLKPILPGPSVISWLSSAALHSWRDSLTTTVPVGNAGHLLVIPWISGLACGVACLSFSLRWRRWATAALLFPAAFYLVAILLGVSEPAWHYHATAVVCVGLVWGSWRQRRGRTHSNRLAWSRPVAATMLLGLSAAAGLALGQTSLVRGSTARLVERDRVKPPIAVDSYPSPLAAFRDYRVRHSTETLFTVTGVRNGDRLRLATLDYYDGDVWRVSADSGPNTSSGYFERVGSVIPLEGAVGQSRTIGVQVDGYDGPWVPDLGPTRTIRFNGDHAGTLANDFRYDLASGTAADLHGLSRGDSYQVTSIVPPSGAGLTVGSPDPGVALLATPASLDLQKYVTELASGGTNTSALAQAQTIASHFNGTAKSGRRGYLSDGVAGQQASLPGEGVYRIGVMLNPKYQYFVGDEEQYSSAMALLADQIGLPARVVVGFKLSADGEGTATVTGRDITAWVEVAVRGHGWVTLNPTPSQTKITTVKQDSNPPAGRIPHAPPALASTITARSVSRGGGLSKCKSDCGTASSGLMIPAWVTVSAAAGLPPIVLVGGAIAAIAWLKLRRRKRRRTTGSPSDRVAAGWTELCDMACDLGDAVPLNATRRETAVLLGRPGVPVLARTADELVFGVGAVSADAAVRYWQEVDTARSAMLASSSSIGRIKALVNPTSLRRGRPSRIDLAHLGSRVGKLRGRALVSREVDR